MAKKTRYRMSDQSRREFHLQVLNLDNHTCQNKNCRLRALVGHHIIFGAGKTDNSIQNGIALCPECHYKVHCGEGITGRSGLSLIIEILEQHIGETVPVDFEWRWRDKLEKLKTTEARKCDTALKTKRKREQ